MGKFAENLNLGKRVLSPLQKVIEGRRNITSHGANRTFSTGPWGGFLPPWPSIIRRNITSHGANRTVSTGLWAGLFTALTQHNPAEHHLAWSKQNCFYWTVSGFFTALTQHNPAEHHLAWSKQNCFYWTVSGLFTALTQHNPAYAVNHSVGETCNKRDYIFTWLPIYWHEVHSTFVNLWMCCKKEVNYAPLTSTKGLGRVCS